MKLSTSKQRRPTLMLRLKSKQRTVRLVDLQLYDDGQRRWYVVDPKLHLIRVLCGAIQNHPQFLSWVNTGYIQVHHSLRTIAATRVRAIFWKGQFWLQPIDCDRGPDVPARLTPPPHFPSIVVRVHVSL